MVLPIIAEVLRSVAIGAGDDCIRIRLACQSIGQGLLRRQPRQGGSVGLGFQKLLNFLQVSFNLGDKIMKNTHIFRGNVIALQPCFNVAEGCGCGIDFLARCVAFQVGFGGVGGQVNASAAAAFYRRARRPRRPKVAVDRANGLAHGNNAKRDVPPRGNKHRHGNFCRAAKQRKHRGLEPAGKLQENRRIFPVIGKPQAHLLPALHGIHHRAIGDGCGIGCDGNIYHCSPAASVSVS